jgi:uncharacterized membrane protein YkvA (DUF1232 family)
VGWPAKVILLLVIAYVLSPIDLIPDWIPVLGYLDDAIVIPLGVGLATRLIPREIMAEHRAEARNRFTRGRPKIWKGCLIVLGIWLVLTALVVFIVVELVRRAKS